MVKVSAEPLVLRAELIEGASRFHLAGLAPIDELDRVDAAVAVFDLVDGAGGQADGFGQAALGVAGGFAEFEQPLDQAPVGRLVLGLFLVFLACSHLRSTLKFDLACFDM